MIALLDFDTSASKSQYGNIIEELKRFFPLTAISFFTTNYDLTFEDSQSDLIELVYPKHGIKEVNYGFKNKANRTYWSENYSYDWSSEVLEYKKLHGSLDWNWDNNKRIIQTMVPNEPVDPNRMILLYPGFKGNPNGDPYKRLHDDLFERLLTADILFVIGFVFRDDFINNIFDVALKINKNLEVRCYNPAEQETLPAESKLTYLAKKYGKRFQYVKHAIEPSENPLQLHLYL